MTYKYKIEPGPDEAFWRVVNMTHNRVVARFPTKGEAQEHLKFLRASGKSKVPGLGVRNLAPPSRAAHLAGKTGVGSMGKKL